MPELATFVLFAYRHEAFVAEAIRGIAQQTYRPLELIVTDDASPDRTREQIYLALRNFPSDISVFRINHETNQGLSGVINMAVRRASGRVIIFGAGDDISTSERVARTMEAFRDPEVTIVHTATMLIDEKGKSMKVKPVISKDTDFNLHETISGEANPIVGASCAYAADIFKSFGELPREILREDVLLPIRSLLLGKGRFLAERLVQYRMHAGNLHSPSHRQSSEEMVARNIRFAADRRSCSEQIFADADTLREKGICLTDDFLKYMQKGRAYSELEQELLHARSRADRFFKIFTAWVRRKVGTITAVKLVTLFLLPGLYAPLLKLRVRFSQRNSQSSNE